MQRSGIPIDWLFREEAEKIVASAIWSEPLPFYLWEDPFSRGRSILEERREYLAYKALVAARKSSKIFLWERCGLTGERLRVPPPAQNWDESEEYEAASSDDLGATFFFKPELEEFLDSDLFQSLKEIYEPEVLMRIEDFYESEVQFHENVQDMGKVDIFTLSGIIRNGMMLGEIDYLFLPKSNFQNIELYMSVDIEGWDKCNADRLKLHRFEFDSKSGEFNSVIDNVKSWTDAIDPDSILGPLNLGNYALALQDVIRVCDALKLRYPEAAQRFRFERSATSQSNSDDSYQQIPEPPTSEEKFNTIMATAELIVGICSHNDRRWSLSKRHMTHLIRERIEWAKYKSAADAAEENLTQVNPKIGVHGNSKKQTDFNVLYDELGVAPERRFKYLRK